MSSSRAKLANESKLNPEDSWLSPTEEMAITADEHARQMFQYLRLSRITFFSSLFTEVQWKALSHQKQKVQQTSGTVLLNNTVIFI